MPQAEFEALVEATTRRAEQFRRGDRQHVLTRLAALPLLLLPWRRGGQQNAEGGGEGSRMLTAIFRALFASGSSSGRASGPCAFGAAEAFGRAKA